LEETNKKRLIANGIANAIEKEKEIWRPLDGEGKDRFCTTLTDNCDVLYKYYFDYKKYTTG